MRKTIVRTALLGAAMLTSSLAFAQGQVVGNVEAFLVSVDKDGREVISKVEKAVPGEMMEYRLTFINNSDSAVKGLKVTDPVPVHTTFVPDSAQTDVAADFLVSIDGGESFETTPVTRTETQADGSQKEVVIPPEQYTHIRWNVEESLNSDGASHVYAYRVVIN